MTAPVPTLTPAQQQAAAAAAAYDAQQAALRDQMIAALIAIWAGMAGAAWTAASAAAFVKAVLPISLGAQTAMAALTNAHLSRLVGRPPAPIPMGRVTGAPLRNGVDPAQVYVRPIKTMNNALAQGKPLGQAIDLGQKRLTDIAASDIQLAKTHTSREVISRAAQNPTGDATKDVVGFRRVLSDRGNHCALCIVASTQRYHSFALSPMHPNCQCSVAPITGTEPVDRVLDEDMLNQLHDIIAADLGEKYVARAARAEYTEAGELNYRDIIIVNQHGELGPVLGVRGQNFTGPDDIRRLTHKPIADQLPDEEIPE